MASIIRIKRSSGTNKPSSLNWGELAYVTGIGSYGGTNQYKDRIFVGDDGANVNPVGGYYYTSMMEHQPGAIDGVTNTRNQDGGIVAVLDSNRKVDQWNVDNLRLDGNTFSSQNTDGDIVLDPNGTGEINIVDDTYLSFGTDKDVKLRYDEATDNRFEIEGADWAFADGVAINIGDVTQSSDKDTGALVVEGGVGIEKNLNVGGNATIAGVSTFTGSVVIGDVRIEDNVISTIPGSGNVLYIDPYPDGLSNEGTVVIKGDLQVDGTTTSVNSTAVTINDPIIVLGDVTSARTVMSPVASGVSTITLDSVTGINTGDTIQGSASLPNAGLTTITSYNPSTKIITIEGATSSGIVTTTQLTITHAYDTNTDRGIAFDYNTSSGVANNKTGFFGYIDGTNTGSSAPVRSWTYIPDSTISNSVAIGTRGYLDIKGIYYQTGDFSTHGVVYFDSTGLQTSTNDPASPTITSKQVLTAITEITLTFGSAASVTAGDIILQDTSGAYGIVKTTVNSSTITLVGVEGTFTNTYNVNKNSVSLSLIPTTVTTIYTNKPTWTSTLDGGTFWFMASEVDINLLMSLYNQKVSQLSNQNILLEAKLQTLSKDFEEEKNLLLEENLNLQEKYDALVKTKKSSE